MTIDDLLERHGAYSLERQDALSEFLGEHRWDVDVPAGTVDFGAGRVYPIQLIGTESAADGSWLWAWANTSSNLPPRLLESARRIRQVGEQLQVPELLEAHLGAGTFDPHVLGLIASGLMSADAYYLGHHGGGAVLFLIEGAPLKPLLKPSVLRMNTFFMTFVSSYEVPSAQRALVAYAEAKGCRIQATGSRVDCTDLAGDRLTADFDELGRLVRLSADAGPDRSRL